MTLARWDDVERARREVGDMRSWWRDLGGAAGATAAGPLELAETTWRPACIATFEDTAVDVGGESELFVVLDGGGSPLLYDRTAALARPKTAGVGRVMVRFDTVEDYREGELDEPHG